MPSDAVTDGMAALAPDARSESAGAPKGGGREIILRVVSAAVMAPLGLWAVSTGGLAIVIAAGLCAVVASGEWGRMAMTEGAPAARLGLHAVLAATAISAAWAGQTGLDLVCLVGLAGALIAGGLAKLLRLSPFSMAFGALYTSLPFGAFVWIREGLEDGRLYLFAILAVVWATDIAAYFAGRGFGGPLLSPKDSPNKTWTGAIGAVVCAVLAGVAVARAFGGDPVHWLFASLLLSIVAQAGDLLESRFKRLYGVKDTSGLVPGHGGVLDRLDALMAATLVFAVVVRIVPAAASSFAAG